MTHTDQDNQAFDTMERPPAVAIRPRRQMTRFEIWAWSPVVSFQIGLTASDLGMVYFGVSSAIHQPSGFDNSAPEMWAGLWSLALILGGIVGGLGSVHRSKLFSRIELVGSSLVSLTVGSYAILVLYMTYILDDTSRGSMGAGLVALVVPVLVRTLWLLSLIHI